MHIKHYRAKSRLALLLLLVTGLLFVQCGASEDSDDENTATLLALLSLSRFQFRWNTSLSTTSAFSRAGTLPNMAGTLPANYGDGTGDGFTDAFLTPVEVVMSVKRVVAWKSEANGGPAAGQERESNADFIIYDCARDTSPTGNFCTASVNIGSASASYYLSRWAGLPDETYDRIGIGITGFTYQFNESVTENNLRWINVPTSYSASGFNPLALVRNSNCPDYLSQLTESCAQKGGKIDASNGSIAWVLSDAVSTFGEFSPRFSISDYTITGSAVAMTPPTDQVANADETFYEVFTVNAATLNGSPVVNVDMDPTNVLFWDTTGDGSSFDVSTDGPNGSGKDMKYHLPIMRIGVE